MVLGQGLANISIAMESFWETINVASSVKSNAPSRLSDLTLVQKPNITYQMKHPLMTSSKSSREDIESS